MPRLHKAFQHHQLKGDFLQETLEHILYLTDVEISRLLIIGDTRRIRIIDLDHDMTSADGMELRRTELELAELPDHLDDLKSLADYRMVQFARTGASIDSSRPCHGHPLRGPGRIGLQRS